MSLVTYRVGLWQWRENIWHSECMVTRTCSASQSPCQFSCGASHCNSPSQERQIAFCFLYLWISSGSLNWWPSRLYEDWRSIPSGSRCYPPNLLPFSMPRWAYTVTKSTVTMSYHESLFWVFFSKPFLLFGGKAPCKMWRSVDGSVEYFRPVVLSSVVSLYDSATNKWSELPRCPRAIVVSVWKVAGIWSWDYPAVHSPCLL